jgi:hypothetical protein
MRDRLASDVASVGESVSCGSAESFAATKQPRDCGLHRLVDDEVAVSFAECDEREFSAVE